MLEIALECIRRGWFVFPCVPKTKRPLLTNGFKGASNDEVFVRLWWAKWPDANVAIATGASCLVVVDIDHGLRNYEDVLCWLDTALGFPHDETYAVRTGRRDSFGVQIYFGLGADEPLKSIAWLDGELSGDIRSSTGYVMAAGSIHPDSKEKYEVLISAPVAPVPEYVRRLKPKPVTGTPGQANAPVQDDGVSLISDHRNVHMISLLGKKRSEGFDDDALREWALETNESRFNPPLDESELERLISNACRYSVPEVAPPVLIGGKVVEKAEAQVIPVDWRSHYHTFEELDNAPPMDFLIQDFMHVESITGLAANVAQRKSLIALNIAHALCTGEALFGKFEVVNKPKRVLYICPEMGMRSFTKRIRAIGLMPYVCKTLFCRTMNKEDHLALADLTPDELDGAVVIVDTAVRFMEGDENSSEDMRALAESLFRLIPKGDTPGAMAILVLYHSGKGNKESNELTLENVLRGSGELGASLTCCWATRLQDPDTPFVSRSFIACVKPRDFDSDPRPFEAECGENGKMTYVPQDGDSVPVLKVRNKGNVGNKDGMDEAAMVFIKADLDLSGAKMSARLLEHDIKRSPDWINRRRAQFKGTGVKSTSA